MMGCHFICSELSVIFILITLIDREPSACIVSFSVHFEGVGLGRKKIYLTLHVFGGYFLCHPVLKCTDRDGFPITLLNNE